ncbi:MAG TPA: hypothetical protein VKZ85_03860 [Woeseiaceae bacterium]|nr:hypothetical protein [Woeseiaceae bacterium]
MSLAAETEALRRRLGALADEADADLERRYALRPLPGERPGPYRRMRKRIGRLLRRLGLRATTPPEPWDPGLKHVPRSEAATPVVIWALGTDRETLRTACRRLAAQLAERPDLSPVLVTDVADFAFFSRLGWLVEYVPALAAPAARYAERKQRHLARRYAGAPALPVSAGLGEESRLEELLLG